MRLDPRLNAIRPDLADARLEGRVSAPRFVTGTAASINAAIVPLLGAPRFDARRVSEALIGEGVMVFAEDEGWAWVQLARDGYVGYLNAEALGPVTTPTHRVCVPLSFCYPVPDIKTRPEQHLPMHAALTVIAEENGFARLAEGGFVYRQHLKRLSEFETDPAAVAECFLHAPYLWGGKSWRGLDCSGLVQLACQSCNIDAPRDSDMQQTLGHGLADDETLQRNDLVFWKGHVGIMLSPDTLLHANGSSMQVTAEPFAEAEARIAATGSAVIARRRLAQ